jgi:Arc/MetJ-type ribon-helix-helix transcriptional regulator
MTIQIAVRLSEETVEYLDNQVRLGRAKSRADIVDRALARERRRETAEKDLEVILRDQKRGIGDLNGLAASAQNTPLDLD